MKNAQFRDEFLTYFGQQLATTFSTENVLARMQERYQILDPLLDDQFAKWGPVAQRITSRAMKVMIQYAQQRPTKMHPVLQRQGRFRLEDQHDRRAASALFRRRDRQNPERRLREEGTMQKRNQLPARHELKYFIHPAEVEALRNRLRPAMTLDSHCVGGRPYVIRSLYFDDIDDSAYYDKEAGVIQPRQVPHPHLPPFRSGDLSSNASASWAI